MNLFSHNLKLKKDNIFKFSLPMALTCPGAGECRIWCYMDGVYRLRGRPVIARHKRNFELTKKPWFHEIAIHEIKSRPNIKLLRIHDSGDYYGQTYLNKWYKIAVACPSVFFYSYTKSLHLDFKAIKKLDNVKIIQSEGGRWPVDKRCAHAVVISRGSRIPVGYMNASRSDKVSFYYNKIALYKRG